VSLQLTWSMLSSPFGLDNVYNITMLQPFFLVWDSLICRSLVSCIFGKALNWDFIDPGGGRECACYTIALFVII